MNSETHKKLLVVQVAGLSHTFDAWPGPELRAMQSVFPAVTCTVQGSFRTASLPREHGMIANGLFRRDLGRVMFWEQSARLVKGERIWSEFRQRGGKVAMLFWQQSMGEDVDIVVSPAPIHKHHGGMIQDCYSRPAGLYQTLCARVGRPFKLRHYWGPMASTKSGDWIADATAALLADAELAPDLCLTYLPTLDYDLQRFGPDHAKAAGAADAAKRQLLGLLDAAASRGYEVVIFGDYAIAPVSQAAFPNLALLKAGLMSVRNVSGMLYPDLYASRAFAMVDHEVAHVYVRDPGDVEGVRELLSATDGVRDILDRAAQVQAGLDHPNSGELVLRAGEDRWFAYPWWTDKRQAPDYARHVDIHNKPGFDPCELFWGWPPGSVSQNTSRIRGSHAQIGPGREVLWGATFDLPGEVDDIIGLAFSVRDWLH